MSKTTDQQKQAILHRVIALGTMHALTQALVTAQDKLPTSPDGLVVRDAILKNEIGQSTFFDSIQQAHKSKAISSSKNILANRRDDCAIQKHVFWNKVKNNYSSDLAYHDAKTVQTVLLQQKGPACVLASMLISTVMAFSSRLRKPFVAFSALGGGLYMTSKFIQYKRSNVVFNNLPKLQYQPNEQSRKQLLMRCLVTDFEGVETAINQKSYSPPWWKTPFEQQIDSTDLRRRKQAAQIQEQKQ